MKRISIILALLVLLPATTRAFHSQRYRIVYNPYAFSYHHSGLVPGSLKYSMDAFGPNHSGLVDYGMRYDPYAFKYGRSGLVSDYSARRISLCVPCVVPCKGTAPPVARRTTPRRIRPVHKVSSEQLREIRETDGLHVIRQYLAEHGIDNVRIIHGWHVKNRTAGAIFILREQGLVVRYTNPEILASMAAGSVAQRTALERQEQRWETVAKAFQETGGAVYCIDTTDKDQMVAALDQCDALVPGGATLQPAPLYAKD